MVGSGLGSAVNPLFYPLFYDAAGEDDAEAHGDGHPLRLSAGRRSCSSCDDACRHPPGAGKDGKRSRPVSAQGPHRRAVPSGEGCLLADGGGCGRAMAVEEDGSAWRPSPSPPETAVRAPVRFQLERDIAVDAAAPAGVRRVRPLPAARGEDQGLDRGGEPGHVRLQRAGMPAADGPSPGAARPSRPEGVGRLPRRDRRRGRSARPLPVGRADQRRIPSPRHAARRPCGRGDLREEGPPAAGQAGAGGLFPEVLRRACPKGISSSIPSTASAGTRASRS